MSGGIKGKSTMYKQAGSIKNIWSGIWLMCLLPFARTAYAANPTGCPWLGLLQIHATQTSHPGKPTFPILAEAAEDIELQEEIDFKSHKNKSAGWTIQAPVAVTPLFLVKLRDQKTWSAHRLHLFIWYKSLKIPSEAC